jgi:hypothetical protein
MDNEGIDPSTSRMRNERSTTDLIAQPRFELGNEFHIILIFCRFCRESGRASCGSCMSYDGSWWHLRLFCHSYQEIVVRPFSLTQKGDERVSDCGWLRCASSRSRALARFGGDYCGQIWGVINQADGGSKPDTTKKHGQ